MGEIRKRKSLWDMDDEMRHRAGMSEYYASNGKESRSGFDGGHHHEFSATGMTTAPKSRNHSGWTTREHLNRNTDAQVVDSFYNNRQDNAEPKEIARGKSYKKNFSPDFDGAEWRTHSRTPEYDWSGSGRHPGRGRSRSRSRSRSGRRGRSRSRDKVRERGRGRSRSRSRSEGSARRHRRSHTPIRDHREADGWSDGRGRHEKLSQNCREFAIGRCRKGSQCRFLHPEISRSERDRVEDSRAENWRNRPDFGHGSGHSIDRRPEPQSRDDVCDPFYEAESRNRNTLPCRDFVKGKCRWGDACRYSHHIASGDGYNKSARTASFGRDIEQQANKNVKPPCKFFAAGNCNRDNCKFSHDDLKVSNFEGRPGEETRNFSYDNKSSWWDGPSWDDSMKASDNMKSTGWTETAVANTNFAGETALGRTGNRFDRSLGDESRTWGISERSDNYLKRDQQLSLLEESCSYGGDMGSTKPMGEENTPDKQEHTFHDSQLRNEDRLLHVYGQNTMEEGHPLAVEALQHNVNANPHIQQQHQRLIEDNDATLYGSNDLDEVSGSGNPKHPLLFTGHSSNQNGESLFPEHDSFSNENDGNQHVVVDLNGPQQHTHMVSPSRLQSQMQNHRTVVNPLESPELQASQFVSAAVANEQAARMTKSPVGIIGEKDASVMDSSAFVAQRFVNEEQQHQVFAGLDTSNSMGRVPPNLGIARPVPLANTINIQQNLLASSVDLFNATGNGKVDSEYGNHSLSSATVPHSLEQKNELHMEGSTLQSAVDSVFGSSAVKHHESPKVKEQEIISNSEVNVGGQTVIEESKGGPENKHPENVDGHGKVDESIALKDDKVMRLFKNALVEFVKEILKPKWKEGRMSREVHKNIVKKVVDKVSSTIQGDHIPKTQNKVEQYLTASKPKITKLIQAYVERSLKAES